MKSSSSLLLLNKPSAVTSFTSLRPVKRTIDKKVGHAGTLDKFAKGLMIVLTGTFTKLNPLFSSLDKQYVAIVKFGEETETLDPEGKVIATAEVPSISQIEQVIANHFIGEIDQRPPQYSAVHVDGKRAYKLARSGQEVEIPTRRITIFSLEILAWESPYLTLAVHCSKGTYIRSLARDIATACNSRGHLVQLQRTAIGPYTLDEAIDPEDSTLLIAHAESSVSRIARLPHMGSITVSEEAALRLTYGNLPPKHAILETRMQSDDTFAMLENSDGELLAIVGVDDNQLPNKVISLPCMER